MASDRFTLAHSDGQEYRQDREGDGLALNRAADAAGEDELLGVLDRDRTRELLLWVGGESTVTAVFEGPMANEIKKASQESWRCPSRRSSGTPSSYSSRWATSTRPALPDWVAAVR